MAADEDAAAPAVPQVAIVGRPNVGKSTLLNALCRTRVAIVEPTPGVTRDRVGVLCTLAERTVELVDTGGVGIVDRQGLDEHVDAQVREAVANAAALIFVVDAREGRTPLDERVAGMLRRASDRVIFVANKAESDRTEWNRADFAALGYGEPLPISAEQRMSLDELEERLGALLPEGQDLPVRLPPPDLKVALVGRVNAGKSSLVNSLLRMDRMITSEVPGTTRDSVDIRFERDGKAVVVIDTAGIRKERKVQGSVDFYAQRRSEKAIRRADVTVLVLDASRPVERLDRKIAGYAVEGDHPVIIVANKWDLKPDDLKASTFTDYLGKVLPGLAFAPIIYTSALTGHNVDKILDLAWRLREQAHTRIGTGELNRALEAATERRRPRPQSGKLGRIYFASQVEVAPPTFLLFVNDPSLFQPDYLRFLKNRFRESLPFSEVPIRLRLKARDRSPSKNEGGR